MTRFATTIMLLAVTVGAPGCMNALSGGAAGPSDAPSPYAHNPENDVYVDGVYVGSDPDPRIRAQLREEARRGYNAAR